MADGGEGASAVDFAARSILLTGGCGFIGAWTARALRRAYPDSPIVVLDKLDYCSSAVNLDGIANLEVVQGWYAPRPDRRLCYRQLRAAGCCCAQLHRSAASSAAAARAPGQRRGPYGCADARRRVLRAR